jgi:FixJ family two-component response regulator
MPIHRRLKVTEDGVFSLFCSNDRSHLARLHPVTSPLVAIVDDDEALCSSLVDLMRSIGYGAEPFASAETLLMWSNLFLFDCVIADVHMPGMSGLNLVRKLQDQSCMVPVILITALPDKQLDDEAISVGAPCLLRKPFESKALLRYVAGCFSHERAPR